LPRGPVYSLEFTNGGLTTLPGGIPLYKGGVYAGSIGVSGSTDSFNDTDVANSVQALLSNATKYITSFDSPPSDSTTFQLNQAQALVVFAEARSSVTIPSTILVTDQAPFIRVLLRGDNSLLGMSDVARRKAKAASRIGVDTSMLTYLVQPTQQKSPNDALYGLGTDLRGLFLGGATVLRNTNYGGVVVGAVSVAGNLSSSQFDNNAVQSAVLVFNPTAPTQCESEKKLSTSALVAIIFGASGVGLGCFLIFCWRLRKADEQHQPSLLHHHE